MTNGANIDQSVPLLPRGLDVRDRYVLQFNCGRDLNQENRDTIKGPDCLGFFYELAARQPYVFLAQAGGVQTEEGVGWIVRCVKGQLLTRRDSKYCT